MIYLDNSATTRVHEEVVVAMNEYHLNYYGNPSSLHRMGLDAEKAINKARKQVADFLMVEEKSLFFTSGGTEGNNLAITSAINKNKRLGKQIITSTIEHPSVLEVFKNYENIGYEVVYIRVNEDGFLDLEQLESEINEETILVSLMKVNNEVGSIQDTKKIAEVIRKKAPHCIFHSDCVQAVGKVPVNPVKEGMDILTLSGHKFHGPKGIGAIYVNKNLALKPILLGGGQEKGFRSGTENVPAIVGLGVATQNLYDSMKNIDRMYKLKSKAIELLQENIEGIRLNSKDNENYAPHLLNISIRNVKSEILLHVLGKKDIFVSSGSACSSRKQSQSHVLQAMHLPKEYIDGALRLSFSKYNTVDEVEHTVKELKVAVNNLREFTRRR